MSTFVRFGVLLLALSAAACGTISKAPTSLDAERKLFPPPSDGMAGLYIYRDTIAAAFFRKTVYLNGEPIGETAALNYLYREVPPGMHELSTESEFGANDLRVEVSAGQNYFVDQNIRPGLIAPGAYLRLVSEARGRKGVLRCTLVD